MWHDDPYAGGAFAMFEPSQQTLLYEHIIAPEGRIHFAGEHASLRHAWIQGAIESGLRHLLLQRVDLRVESVQQLAQLRGHLGGEGLLEAVQRHQSVAVAVLVAGLTRSRHLGLHPRLVDRRRRRGLRGSAGR
jgi:hypothetical protein